jgi:transcription elongation factor Elf1
MYCVRVLAHTHKYTAPRHHSHFSISYCNESDIVVIEDQEKEEQAVICGFCGKYVAFDGDRVDSILKYFLYPPTFISSLRQLKTQKLVA